MSEPRSGYMREIFLGGLQDSREVPVTTSYAKLEAQAKAKITPQAYGYVAGSASSERTAASNTSAFDDWQIGAPRVGCGCTPVPSS